MEFQQASKGMKSNLNIQGKIFPWRGISKGKCPGRRGAWDGVRSSQRTGKTRAPWDMSFGDREEEPETLIERPLSPKIGPLDSLLVDSWEQASEETYLVLKEHERYACEDIALCMGDKSRSRQTYYEAMLLQSTHGWHWKYLPEWPWITTGPMLLRLRVWGHILQ